MVDGAPWNMGETTTIVMVDNLTRGQIVQYAGASGDYNPLHTDEIYATQCAGFPSVFAHGMLTMGMAGRVLAELYGTDRIVRFGGRFRAQVWPGDALTASIEVTSSSAREIDISIVVRSRPDTVVFDGTAVIKITEAAD
ncbi:MaoC/PaaZ C-terminal domain-containing protein [Sphingomonas oryzagri]